MAYKRNGHSGIWFDIVICNAENFKRTQTVSYTNFLFQYTVDIQL